MVNDIINNDPYGMMRLVLYYADDVVEKTLRMKSQFCYIKPVQDKCRHSVDSVILSNEVFKQRLREKEGIFFDLNVSPSSPSKQNLEVSKGVITNLNWEETVLNNPNNVQLAPSPSLTMKRLYTFCEEPSP